MSSLSLILFCVVYVIGLHMKINYLVTTGEIFICPITNGVSNYFKNTFSLNFSPPKPVFMELIR